MQHTSENYTCSVETFFSYAVMLEATIALFDIHLLYYSRHVHNL